MLTETNTKPYFSAFTVPLYILAALATISSILLGTFNTPMEVIRLLPLSYVFVLAFMVVALLEVYRYPWHRGGERFMWTVGLIFMSLIAGAVYVLVVRRRMQQQALRAFNRMNPL
jgi:hypothetical protein